MKKGYDFLQESGKSIIFKSLFIQPKFSLS